MNNLQNSGDEVVECPLCMEPLEVDDLSFFPCTCGYQICRFCWHRIRTDENELCPACRKEYPENPADFKPLSQEEMIAFKSQKRQRDQQRKQKITENRKHLANVRVVQKNLVFVVGLPPRLADADILKKHDYFGKYGKIHKVVINPSTAYAGVQGPSASAYVTYVNNTDALKAIQSVNNIMIDGRLIKTSLGTTKYCSHFMKNQQCPKGDCMYLHELGDSEASFTKEEMHQGKHQEYEKRLHDVLIASSTGSGISCGNTSTVNNIKTSEVNKVTGSNSNISSSISTAVPLCETTNNLSIVAIASTSQKEAWPSLAISPVYQKESLPDNINKNKKERIKSDRNKNEKNNKTKNNRTNVNTTNLNLLPKESDLPVIIKSPSTNDNFYNDQQPKMKFDKNKEITHHTLLSRSDLEKNSDNSRDVHHSTKIENENKILKMSNIPPISSRNNSSDSCVITTSDNISFVNESTSGKSSHSNFNDVGAKNEHTTSPVKFKSPLPSGSELDMKTSENWSKPYGYEDNMLNENGTGRVAIESINYKKKSNIYLQDTRDNNRYEKIKYNDMLLKDSEKIPTDISDLSILDEYSFFSSTTGILHQSMPLHLKHKDEIPNQLSTSTATNLPDLINGIDGHQNCATNDIQAGHDGYLSNFGQQLSLLQYQQNSNELCTDNVQNTLFGTNMSKFFDFHKNQQQRLQNYSQISGPISLNGNVNETFNMTSLDDRNRLNSQITDQSCISNSQQHHQKQKLFGKLDQVVCHQTMHHVPSQQVPSGQNQYISSSCDDDLGFDPFIETQKALAELIENEEEHLVRTTNLIKNNKQVNIAHQPQQQMMDYMHRARMPPPGFNHVNNLSSYGIVPRTQNNKVISYMNFPNNYAVSTGHHIQHQQQLQIPSNAWSAHIGNFQQHNDEQPTRHVNSNQLQNGSGPKGYTSNDWTAMDPAILSLRQFSFPHHTQVTPAMQNQQQDIFLQQLAQQHSGFTSQSQHLSDAKINIPNAVMSSQQNSQTHVNANVQGMLEYLKTRQFV